MVAGEICAPPPVKPVVALGAAAVALPADPWVSLESSNGFWPNPVDCVEDIAEEASDCIAFIAADAAPTAKNIIHSDTRRQTRLNLTAR
jgi:hypothetical protein